jgi:hypothetical protein
MRLFSILHHQVEINLSSTRDEQLHGKRPDCPAHRGWLATDEAPRSLLHVRG